MSASTPPAGPFYRDLDELLIGNASFYSQMRKIAERILRRARIKPYMLCIGLLAEITPEAMEEVMGRLYQAVVYFAGVNNEEVFSPAPFERRASALRLVREDVLGTQFLEVFYGGLFASGLVQGVYFLPGWQRSVVNGVLKYQLALDAHLPIRILRNDYHLRPYDQCFEPTE
jgi:hypothetical protein